MIELRPRKQARRYSSVSGSDRPDASEEGNGAGPSRAQSCQQVQGGINSESVLVKKKRGRKPKISAPVQCKEESEETQIGLEKASSKKEGLHVSNVCRGNGLLCGQVKRERKPKPVASCAPPPCVSEGLCQKKKSGRKPKAKQKKCEITKLGKDQKKISSGRITSVSLRRLPDANVDRQAGSAQNSFASGQVKRRGRNPKILPCVKCEDLETGDTSCMNYANLGSRSDKPEQVSVCSSGGSRPERKRGRKAGSLLWKTVKGIKNKSLQEEMKGFSCAGKSKIHTIHVRVQRNLLSRVSKKTVVSKDHLKCNVKNPHPEPQHGEESKSSTELICVKMEPRNSRRIKRVDPISYVEKRKLPVTAEQNTNCLMTASELTSVLKVKEEAVKSETSESGVSRCLKKTCHVHSPNLPNPVVRLRNCKSLHHLHCSSKRPLGPRNMLTTMNIQNPLTDSAASDSTSISAKEKVNDSEKVVESTSAVNNQTQIKKLLKVKLNFRKREQKKNSHSEESDTELKSIDCDAKEMKTEGHQHRGDCLGKPKFSRLHNGTLMDKLINNTLISAELNSSNEQNKVDTDPVCNSWGRWRTQTRFVSDEEISDHDFKSSSVTVSSFNFSQATEGLTVTCQRVIPFTGKSIWKCSCARTYVSVLPRKRPADVRNTIILGIEAERSLEIYSNDMHSLFEGIGGESIPERTKENDREAVCKKRKLDLHVESTSPVNFASCESTLDESLSSENRSVRDALLSTSETSDSRLSLPLASEFSWKDMSVECSEHSVPGTAPNDECQFHQLQREDKTHLLSKAPSKTETRIDQMTVTDPVPFKIPNEETRTLLHSCVPVVCSINKDLQNKFCSTSTSLEEVDASALNGNLMSSHNPSDSEDGKSNYCPSEWFDKGDVVKREKARDTTDPLVPASTIKCADDYTLDLLKAYEEDILVLDVIQDDPELFDIEKENCSSKKHCNTNHVTSTKPNKMPLVSKVQKKSVAPAYESKTCLKKIECVPGSSTDLINDFFDDRSDQQSTCNFTPETNEITTHAEIKDSRGPTETQNEDSPQELLHANLLEESKSGPQFQEVLPSNCSSGPQQSFFHHPKSESSVKSNNPPPWMHDSHANRKDTSSAEIATSDSRENWKHENANPRIQQSWLPYGYCRFFFNTFNGCMNKQCAYLHIPKKCDEKVCMDLLHKLINENKTFLLKRAVWIFRNYYSQYPPRLHYDRGIFGALLNPLLNLSLWQDLFHLLETAATANIFPSLDQIIKVFESVTFSGLQTALSTLLDVFCKFVQNGMNVTPVEINHIIAIMSKSNAAKNHINILFSMKSSLEKKISKTNWAYDMDAAMSEIEHCNVNSDWMKLGTLYLTVCTGCENLTKIKNFSRCIAEALMKDSINERPEIPYCEFADTVFKNPQLDDIQKNILGRIGISLMFFYHRKELWLKGRKVIYKFHELKINYTVLKGLSGQESFASRCHVVNIAVEIFLKCGNPGSAVQTLKECDWIISTSMWPCDMMDVLHRHNLLCLLVHEALSKNMFNMCFDVLQNLPGIQESQADLNVSQYAILFNKVLNSCVENRSLGISSSIIDFMIAKKIAIDYLNLRAFITTLGHSTLWTKARGYYKSALALGFYPLFEGKMNPKVLYVPSFMSEVEMLLTLEHFMVANVSSIQSQGGYIHSLQIVLKRLEEDKESYHAAAERLFEASRLSNPRLFIKHMTVNNANEQVYTLDNNSSLKWLNENMKWAGIVWYHH